MEHVTAALSHFLAKHNIQEDAKLIVELPHPDHFRAVDGMKMDLKPWLVDNKAYHYEGRTKINGIVVEFRAVGGKYV